ncbi:MAG: hypothetical protein RR620_13035 [Clostridium sp.]
MEYTYKEFKNTQMGNDTFLDWTEYRKAITNKMLEELDDENKSLIIFGAGECNDIDLKRFNKKFNKITLIDFNEIALQGAIEKHKLQNEQGIEFKKIDFLGVSNATYEEYEEMLINKTPIKKIVKFLRGEANKLLESKIDLNLQKHEVAICLGVHSQITITFVGVLANYLNNYDKKEIKKVYEEIEYMNTKVAKRLNDCILENITSKAIMGFDIMEISKDLGTAILIPSIMDYCSRRDFNNLYDKIVSKNLISGASNGNRDIAVRMLENEINIECFNTIFWPFNINKCYLLYLYTISKLTI